MDLFAQFFGFDDLDVGAELEDFEFYLAEVGDREGEFQAAVGEVVHGLIRVPDLFADPLGAEGVEVEGDGDGGAALEDAEGGLDQGLPFFVGPGFEGFVCEGGFGYAGEVEFAPGLPEFAPADQDPTAHVVLEVVGCDPALCLSAAGGRGLSTRRKRHVAVCRR